MIWRASRGSRFTNWQLQAPEVLALAREFHPTAVSLDVFLPDMLGWTVLNHLKQDPTTRHIPVQMLTLDEDRQHGLARGAFSFITKPTTPEAIEDAFNRIKEYASPRRKRLLVVEDNPAEQLSVKELLGHDDIDVKIATTGAQALEFADEQSFDCMVLDLRLPDMSGFEVLERLRDTPSLTELPVVVFTGKELSPEEDARLRVLARSVVVKGVESPERLLDETALFAPPGCIRSPGGETEHARAVAQLRRRPYRSEGPGGGRRRAKYFCIEQRAGTSRDERPNGWDGPRGNFHH